MALTQISTEGIKNGTITGSDLATNVDLVDNQRLRLGTGNDLQIFHDGSNSRLHNGTGSLILRTGTLLVENAAGNENIIYGVADGAVQLYHNGSKKFETTSTGANVTGALSTTSLSATGGITGTGGNFILGDNDKIKLGASQDLEIYHDGSNSYIQDAGTGSLYIKSSAQLYLQSYGGETFLKADANGAVELYHDNSKKFETRSGGVTVQGQLSVANTASGGVSLSVPDNAKAAFGTSDDLKIYHDGSNSFVDDTGTGHLNIRGNVINIKNTDDNLMLVASGGAHTNLYYNGSKKFETSSTGATVTGTLIADGLTVGDAERIKLGNDGDLELYHTGTETFIKNSTGTLNINNDGVTQIKNYADNEFIAKFTSGGSVELYHNNSKKFETHSAGVKVSDGNLYLDRDNAKVVFGASDDLEIYHHGHSTIQNTNSTAALLISSFETHIVNAALTENIARFKQNAEVELYFDNNLKFTTTTNGVSLFGDVRFNNSTWTGECLTGKIQTHSGHMYFQNASTSGFWIFRLPNGTEAATINSSGTYSSSDERRKKDITTITGAVDTIKKLTGRSFTWKEDNKKSFGLIAQEVETVLPNLITTQTVLPGETNSNPYKMVNYSALTGYFIEAVKELSTKIDVLQTEVAALKAS